MQSKSMKTGSKYQAIRVKFFKELLRLLPDKSWSEDLINVAEANTELCLGYHRIVFPGGIQEIVQALEAWLDDQMLDMLANEKKPKKIRDQIALALEMRILKLCSKKAALKNCSFYLLPTNIITGTEVNWRTCDIIWKYAGDKSVDFNYYTKRGLLLGVYVSAKTFYFGDDSKDYGDTKDFIKNALDNIINIASFKNNIKPPKKEDIPIIRLFS